MLSDLFNKSAYTPRQSLFLAGVAVVMGALLSAMYIVCVAQVQSAQTRHASLKSQHQAVMDCLDSDPRASYTACASHVATTLRSSTLPRAGESAQVARAGWPAHARNQLSAMMPVAYYSR